MCTFYLTASCSSTVDEKEASYYNRLMNLFTIKNLSKSYTDKVLFDDTDLSLEEGEKVGVVGINGTGKSTLLKIVAGLSEPDGGEYVKGNHVHINYLPQMPDFSSDKTVLDYVLDSLPDPGDLEGDAKNMLNQLGFFDTAVKVDTLSGGQKKKLAIIRAFLIRAEILILDEPTNHLDNASIEWLEEKLRAYRGAILMVTHDRYFLDLVCDRIVEIDKGKIYSYKENYEGFLALKAEREAMAMATQKKHENILRKEIAWISRGARARSTKQKAHIQRYEALRDEKKIETDGVTQIDAVSSRLGKKTVELCEVTKSYGNKCLIKDFSFIFLKNDRVGIVGENGCGKSTLLKMITGEILPDSGRVEIGDTVKIGYYAQDCESMDPSEKVIDYIKDTAEYIKSGDTVITASQMLEKFLFNGSLQHQKIEKLSGGEKRRLYLAKVLMTAPNVLLLDEPTNDLDITTLRILEDYLDSFAGIVIAVSHDRYFLDRVTKRLLAFEGNGKIRLYNSSYTEYYLEKKALREENVLTPASSRNLSASAAYKEQKSQNKKLKFTYAEQKEYDSIEQDISDLEAKICELDRKLSDPSISTDFAKLSEITKEKEDTNTLLEQKMERYYYLEDLNEKITQQG